MKSFWQVWTIPLVLFVCTMFGLLAALLGIGFWHWASWITLGLPVLIMYGKLVPEVKRKRGSRE